MRNLGSGMRGTTLGPRQARPAALGLLALAVVVLPDAAFSVVTEKPAEVFILRMMTLAGVSLLAIVPWAAEADGQVRRRLRRWSIPGMAASTTYLVSTDPLYLILGFCLLVGGTLDMWMTRAHLASDSLRSTAIPGEGDRRH